MQQLLTVTIDCLHAVPGHETNILIANKICHNNKSAYALPEYKLNRSNKKVCFRVN